MPELVSTLCTFLVLAPLALMPGMGEFLFRPMAMAVAFAMCSAYILSRTLVPACSALLAQAARPRRQSHGRGQGRRHAGEGNGTATGDGASVARAFAALGGDGRPACSRRTPAGSTCVLRHRLLTIVVGFGLLAATLVVLWPDHAQGVLPRGRRRRLRDVRPRPERHPDRADRGADRRGRGVHQEDDPRARPGALSSPSSGSTPTGRPPTRPTPARWTRSSRSSSRPSASRSAQEYVHLIRDGRGQGPAVPRPGLRLRRRRPGPRRDERGQIDADQHPGHRQEPGAGPRDRREDPRQGASASTAWSTPGSSSGSTTPSTSSTSTAPRPPTWA